MPRKGQTTAPPRAMISARLPLDLVKDLKARAKRERRSISNVIELLLRDATQEDAIDVLS